MRLVFSVVGLLLVALIVLQLAKGQLKAVAPAAPASTAATSPGGGATPPPASTALPKQVQQDVTRALDLSAAARASAVTP